jgi:hypothetical protein
MESVVWGQLGPWGLVSVFVMLVFLGGLIPRWIYNKSLTDKDNLIEKLQRALDLRDEQFGRLFEQNKIIVGLLEDINRAQRQETGSL